MSPSRTSAPAVWIRRHLKSRGIPWLITFGVFIVYSNLSGCGEACHEFREVITSGGRMVS